MTESPQQAARRLAAGAMRDGYKPQALHCYTDGNGSPLYWRIRAKHPDTGDKWIRPMKLNGKGYELGEPEYANGKPLYRLHELVARPDDPVFVCEGEWCVDHLAKLGLLATTSGGADSAGRTDWGPMRERTAIVWPDNDDAGKRYATDVRERLNGVGCIVAEIDVDSLGLTDKSDAVDWLATKPSATASDVLELKRMNLHSRVHVEEMQTTDAASEAPQLTVARLAMLNTLEYEAVRVDQAGRLNIRVGALDKAVESARREQSGVSQGIDFDDVDPWPDPVDPHQLLTEVSGLVRRFIVCEPSTADAVALWIAMTWFMDVVQIAPLAVITAPEKRCGKSQLLFVMGRLVRRPLTASNISPAALFRSIDAWQPTLLVDEADAFMRDNEELRGLLNCGHTRDSAYIVRVVGDDFTPRKFNVWGAKALAGIGRLPDTLMDRSIVLELRRKLPHEQVDRLRYAEAGLFDDCAAKLARFANDCREYVRRARPELPPTLNDRAQDNWEPLLAIADMAGGEWPTRAMKAALKLSGGDSPTMSVGTELLQDIRAVFRTDRDRISTDELINELCNDQERPWFTFNRGKPITPRQLSTRLKEYEIRSQTIRIGHQTPKGYMREWFEEAFARYLPSTGDEIRHTPQASNGAASSVADTKRVAATELQSATAEPAETLSCGGVADIDRDARCDETIQRVARDHSITGARVLDLLEGSDPAELSEAGLNHYVSHKLAQVHAAN